MRIGSKAAVIIAILFFINNRIAQAGLLVDLNAAGLSDGILANWSNNGSLGGSFINNSAKGRGKDTSKPVVEMVDAFTNFEMQVGGG